MAGAHSMDEDYLLAKRIQAQDLADLQDRRFLLNFCLVDIVCCPALFETSSLSALLIIVIHRREEKASDELAHQLSTYRSKRTKGATHRSGRDCQAHTKIYRLICI